MKQQSVTSAPTRLIRWPELHRKIGISRSQIWRLIKAGKFPASVRIGENSIGWIESKIDSWIESRASGEH